MQGRDMDCRGVRERLTGLAAGPLDADEQVVVGAHLDGCEGCRRAVQTDQALNRAVMLLPRHPASLELRRKIAARLLTTHAEAVVTPTPTAAAVNAPATMPVVTSSADAIAGDVAGPGAPAAVVFDRAVETTRAPFRARAGAMPAWSAALLGACTATVLFLVVVRPAGLGGGGDLAGGIGVGPAAGAVSELVREAVNDHLRVVNSVHPIEIESGGIHQVKPWFTGRLEFAPRVAFSGDRDFTLLGGSVGYFRDRRAAVFSFKRRLHTITLLVVPHAGLAWPDDHPKAVGPLSVTEEMSRGFALLFWRAGDLGYVLISDINRGELEDLAGRLDRE